VEYVGGGKLLFSVVEGKLVLLLFVSILNFVSLVEQPPNESEPRLCLLFVFVRHDCSTNC